VQRLITLVSTLVVPAVLVALASPDWGWVLMRLAAQAISGRGSSQEAAA
jgi:hypothetical protein